MKRRLLYVGLATLAIAAIVAAIAAVTVARAGLLPVRADAAPSALEKRFFTMAVHASVARSAAPQAQGDSPSDDDLDAGAEIYKGACAECHGQLNGKSNLYGASFYPPAPQFPGHPFSYSQAEAFWIVKHGIRNTAMPAWGNLLSDDEIRKVAAFVKQLDASSPKNEPSRAAR